MNSVAIRRMAARRHALVAARPTQCRAYSEPARDPQLGDYPDVPPVHRAHLPPRGWWDNQMRRNFGDLPHHEDELYQMWGPDPPQIPARTALFQFSVAATVFGSIMFFAYKVTPERKAVPRQYPFDGLVNELGGLEENKAAPESLEEDDAE